MDPSRKRLLIGLAAAFVAAAIFMAGYVPGQSRARAVSVEADRLADRLRSTEVTLARTELDLRVALLRGELGEVLHEANANNFGVAGERATAFFDGLQATAGSPHLDQDRRARLGAVLARRDEISADLARADAAVKQKLAQMYLLFGNAQGSLARTDHRPE